MGCSITPSFQASSSCQPCLAGEQQPAGAAVRLGTCCACLLLGHAWRDMCSHSHAKQLSRNTTRTQQAAGKTGRKSKTHLCHIIQVRHIDALPGLPVLACGIGCKPKVQTSKHAQQPQQALTGDSAACSSSMCLGAAAGQMQRGAGCSKFSTSTRPTQTFLTLPVAPHTRLLRPCCAAAIGVVSRLLANGRLVAALAQPPQVVTKAVAHARPSPAVRHGSAARYAPRPAAAAAGFGKGQAQRKQRHRCRASSCRRRRRCHGLPPPAWPQLRAPPCCTLLL